MTIEEELKEATSLLEMFKDCCADEPRERVRAFLSRTAPQPGSAQASAAGGAKHFDWDRTPAQPAAPVRCEGGCLFNQPGPENTPYCARCHLPAVPVTPEQLREAFARGMRDARIVAGDPVTPAAPTAVRRLEADGFYAARVHPEPAAPEPSGDLQHEYPGSHRFQANYWREKCQSAEAQLAAVRTIATDMVAQLQKVGYLPAKTRVMRYEGFIEALMRGFVDIAALLTAPSPGEGEETLARPDPDLMRHHHDQCGAWHGHSCDCHITPAADPGRSGK